MDVGMLKSRKLPRGVRNLESSHEVYSKKEDALSAVKKNGMALEYAWSRLKKDEVEL